MRKESRDYHTKLGWWVMAHKRGGPALIGAAAIVLLFADLGYAASRWNPQLERWFFIALAVIAGSSLLPLTLTRARQVGDPAKSRGFWRELVFLSLAGAFVWISPARGDGYTGEILGLVAGCACGVIVFAAYWLRSA